MVATVHTDPPRPVGEPQIKHRVPGYGAHSSGRPASQERWIPTVCGMCYNECSIQVLVRDGVAVAVEGLPGAPPNYGKMCAKGKAALSDLYNPRRITRPMKRTNPEKGLDVDPRWQEITWDEALNTIAERMREVRKRNPAGLQVTTFDDSGMVPFVPAFGSAFGGVGKGSGVPNSSALFCGNGIHPVAYMLNGSNDHQPDLTYCQYLIQVGTGYGTGTQSNAMGIARDLANARVKRGLKMVVVDPNGHSSGARADEWIPIVPGTDSAFCLSVANVLVNELDIYDREYLRSYTNSTYLIRPNGHYYRDPATGKPTVLSQPGNAPVPFDTVESSDMALEGQGQAGGETLRTSFVLLKEHLKKYTPEYSSQVTTVPASTIRRIAKEFGTAARIGATVDVDGVELPLRPAHVLWYRGISQHQHGLHNGWSAGMLNVLVGAVDVPGGSCQVSSTGPWWYPHPDPDGLIISDNPFMGMQRSLPARAARLEKDDTNLLGLFPVAVYSNTVSGLTIKEPEKFKIDHRLEIWFHARSNPMATGASREDNAEILKRVPFQVSFVQHMEETAYFADVILPDTHYLERFSPLIVNPYRHYRHAATPDDKEWVFASQQPVVTPMGEAKPWVQVLWDLADRAGFADDYYAALNAWLRLPPDYQLKPGRKYTMEQFADLWMKGYCGEEHDIKYFGEHGYAAGNVPREVKHRYARVFHKGRVPLYLEHWLAAGESIKEVVAETGLEWGDLSDYEPLVNYRPCWASEDGGTDFPLYLVNYKVGFLNFSHTLRNPQLRELAWASGEIFNIGIHPSVAQAQGIENGDLVEIESSGGKRVEAIARVTNKVHPKVVSVPGVLTKQMASESPGTDKAVHFNDFISYDMKRIDMVSAALDACVKIRIKKVNGRRVDWE